MNAKDVETILNVRTELERQTGPDGVDARRLEGCRIAVRLALRRDLEAKAENGGDRKSEKYQIRGTKPINGDTAEHILARLKRDDPHLAEQVIQGDLTPNAAARAKGWRPPRIQLRKYQ